MKIAKDTVVSLAYQLHTKDGALVDEATAQIPLEYLHGHDNLITGLEKALAGRQAGDKFTVNVPADEAYGPYDDNLVQRVPKEIFAGTDEITVGMRFIADTDQGEIPVEITAVEGDHVVVDGNPMLAGQDLDFKIEIIDVRAATAEEISHGHAHGADGHHHHDHDDSCGHHH